MKKYTLSHLKSNLNKFKQGDLFKITGQENIWEYFDENKDYYILRNTITKQEIFLRK